MLQKELTLLNDIQFSEMSALNYLFSQNIFFKRSETLLILTNCFEVNENIVICLNWDDAKCMAFL